MGACALAALGLSAQAAAQTAPALDTVVVTAAREAQALRTDDVGPRVEGLRHRPETRPADTRAPQRRDAAVLHHRRPIAGAVEIDRREILVLFQA